MQNIDKQAFDLGIIKSEKEKKISKPKGDIMSLYKKNLLACVMLISSTLFSCRHELDHGITEIKTQTELQNILTKSQGPVVISLSMQNCGWCHKMAPIIEKAAHNKKFENIAFYKADAHALTPDEGKESIPTEDIVVHALAGQLGNNDEVKVQLLKHTKKSDKNEQGDTIITHVPGYPFIIFINNGKCVGKQVGGIVRTQEQINKKISEEQVFADKLSAIFPNSIDNDTKQNKFNLIQRKTQRTQVGG